MYDTVKDLNVNVQNVDLDVEKPATDTNKAKDWIARIFLLFKQFDFREIEDKTKFFPVFDEFDDRKRDEAKLEEMRVEETRLTGQKKALLLEIEDVGVNNLFIN